MRNNDTKASKEKRRKIAVTTVAAVLLSLLYIVIFSFSAQNSEQSGNLSYTISERWVELMNGLNGGKWKGQAVAALAAFFEHPIRKLAHFSEYAGMGLLVCLMWHPWIRRRRKLWAISLPWVFLSAAADEIHQLFVPGRYGCFGDVCLDTLGGACGVALCILAARIYRVTLGS